MDTIILCGGRGMRAWPLTEDTPKPLLRVGRLELVTRVMALYAANDFNRFVLAVGYKADMFREAFGPERCRELGVEIDFCDSGEDAGTATRIVEAARMCDGDLINVTYGDGIGDVNLCRVWSAASHPGRAMALTAVQPRSTYGELMLDGDRVRMFVEKPVTRRWINGGFMVLHRTAIAKAHEYVERDRSCMFVREPMRELVAAGRVGAHKHRGFWACVDTPKDLAELNDAERRGELICPVSW